MQYTPSNPPTSSAPLLEKPLMHLANGVSESSAIFSAIYRIEKLILTMRGYHSRFIETSVGYTHVYEKQGSGALPPIVLLHGLNSTGGSMQNLFYNLQKRFKRIMVPEMMGHGFSALPRGGTSPETIQTGLFETMQHLTDEPVILFGNSLGGIAAIRYALAHPEKVRGLILVSPGGAQINETQLQALLARFDLKTHEDALQFVDNLHHKPPFYRQIAAVGMKTEFARGAIRQFIQKITPQDLLTPQDFRSLAMPVHLIWGKAEKLFPASYLDFFKANLPASATVEEPENFSHCPFLEYPKALADKVIHFAQTLA